MDAGPFGQRFARVEPRLRYARPARVAGDHATRDGAGGVDVAAGLDACPDRGRIIVEVTGGYPEREGDGVLCGHAGSVAEFVGRLFDTGPDHPAGPADAAAHLARGDVGP